MGLKLHSNVKKSYLGDVPMPGWNDADKILKVDFFI